MIVGVDIGGTLIKVSLVDQGRVHHRTQIEAESHKGLAPALPRIAAAFRELLDEGSIALDACKAVVFSFPSLVDHRTGKVLFGYGKFMDAMELDLPTWAHAEWNLPLLIENDARVALLGERYAGAGKGFENLVMVTLGTGLGVAVCMEGHLLRGVHGQAAILGGHLSIDPQGFHCHCGSRGCPEAEASTSVLVQRAQAHPHFPESLLAKAESIDYAAVFRLARLGDSVSIDLRARAIEVWSTMLINLIHAYDPERIIVGGGIAAGWDDFMPEVIDRVYQWNHTPWGRVEMVPAELGNDAALVGCEQVYRHRLTTTV
jgi:glucokinase